jgi:hypothetical protein
MLMKTPTTTIVHPDRSRQMPLTITGNRITKGYRDNKYERARLAASLVRGEIDVRPTTAMAARALRTTEYLVKCELESPTRSELLRRHGRSVVRPGSVKPAAPLTADSLSTMSATDRARLWSLFDDYTAPPAT